MRRRQVGGKKAPQWILLGVKEEIRAHQEMESVLMTALVLCVGNKMRWKVTDSCDQG